MKHEYYIENGIARWYSNHRCVPVDCLESHGIQVNRTKQAAARATETTDFLKRYRKNMENHETSAEELFELRAAFGTGKTIVNALTGKTIRI